MRRRHLPGRGEERRRHQRRNHLRGHPRSKHAAVLHEAPWGRQGRRQVFPRLPLRRSAGRQHDVSPASATPTRRPASRLAGERATLRPSTSEGHVLDRCRTDWPVSRSSRMISSRAGRPAVVNAAGSAADPPPRPARGADASTRSARRSRWPTTPSPPAKASDGIADAVPRCHSGAPQANPEPRSHRTNARVCHRLIQSMVAASDNTPRKLAAVFS